jgi:hypothetical protein
MRVVRGLCGAVFALFNFPYLPIFVCLTMILASAVIYFQTMGVKFVPIQFRVFKK